MIAHAVYTKRKLPHVSGIIGKNRVSQTGPRAEAFTR